MSLRINQNIISLRTYGTLSKTSSQLEKSISKLSSGLRINNASDDAAGLAISEKMRRQIRGLSRATLNAQDGISMIQTAEGALGESQSILQRMRELAVQSANDVLTSNDRLEIQNEVLQLRDELNRIANSTEFNTKKLLDGSQTALISATSDAVKGIVNGPVRAGGDYSVSIGLLTGGVSQLQRSQIFTINDGSGKLADAGTELQSISQFYNADGVFVLDTPRTLTIQGNGNSTEIAVDGQMTLNDLAADIQNALVSSNGLEIERSQVKVVSTVQTKIAGAGGYIEMVSGFVGDQGEFSFASSQAVMDSLGLSVNREAVNSRFELSSKDSFGNTRSVTTEGNSAKGLLSGIDLKFNSQAAQIAGTGGIELGLKFTTDQTFSLSVNNTAVNINIVNGGAHGWTMGGISRSINDQIAAAGSAVEGLFASVVDGEIRISYEKPSWVAASTGNTLVVANATNNARALGLVDGSYSGFVDGSKNLDVTEWGFSRYVSTVTYNVAEGTDIELDIFDGSISDTIIFMETIGSSTGTAADMVLITSFQASVNNGFNANNMHIRVDQAGSSMVFTSLRVGTENRDNKAAMTSLITIDNMVGSNLLLDRFGLYENTSKGSGDANFKVHIVDNQSQFQLGADQGQVMKVSLSDMSARALGVDKIDLTNIAGANEAMGKLNRAIDMVSSERSRLGAYQNRLEYSINNLRNTHSNLLAAESRIRDADIATEMIEFTRNQIMQQSGTAMLAQANMVPKGVLELING